MLGASRERQSREFGVHAQVTYENRARWYDVHDHHDHHGQGCAPRVSGYQIGGGEHSGAHPRGGHDRREQVAPSHHLTRWPVIFHRQVAVYGNRHHREGAR